MAFFQGQFANVVEWQEYRDDVIFWTWENKELKKGSRLVIRPGQDAIFLHNGRIEGIFTDEGNYELESEIIPFLSTLKGFKFGFNSGLRAEIVFVNNKEFTVKWGTKSAVLIPVPELPGGLPIRAFGVFTMKVSDYVMLIDKIAGVKKIFTVDDIKDRIVSVLDGLLMRWISQEGKNMFNLQLSADAIGRGICSDLDYEMQKNGLTITTFSISSFNYPDEIQNMINKTASYHMVGDVDKFQRISVSNMMSNPNNSGSGAMNDAAGAMIGMTAGLHMAREIVNQPQAAGAKFCSQCGQKLEQGMKFCSSCGNKIS